MEANRTEYTDKDRELASLFRYASRLMARADHGRRRGGHGRHAQGRVLAVIGKHGPLSQGELLRMLDVRSSSLSEVLSKLEAKGLVTRERNEADRRGFIVSATGAGDALLAEGNGMGRDFAESVFACLDAEEKKALHAILHKLVVSLGSRGRMNDAPEQPARGRGGGRKGRGGRGRGGQGGGGGRR